LREPLFPLSVIAGFIAMVFLFSLFLNPMVCLGHRTECISG